jgi:tetratricopeptide (TPR) repeat protein
MGEPLIKDYLALLNDEEEFGSEAAECLLAAPAHAWPTLLHEHPDWIRFGTLDYLLNIAHDDLYRDPLHALAIANLVVAHVDAIPRVFPDEFLYVQLRGLAWKELASALYTLKEYEQAEKPAEAAVTTFAERSSLAVDWANARFVQAQIWHERGRTAAALTALDDAVQVYAEYGDAQRYLWTIEFLANIKFDCEEYVAARDLYTTAIEEAVRLHDVEAEARSRSNRGACEVYLGEDLEASEDLRRALTSLVSLGMSASVPATIWTFAKLTRRQGDLYRARTTLEAVYATFLRLGMIQHAMSVLVELSTLVAELDGDVPTARLLCGRFVQAIGPYKTEESVRAAADYLARATAHVETRDDFVAAVKPVREFCQSSPSAVFVPPDAMIA